MDDLDTARAVVRQLQQDLTAARLELAARTKRCTCRWEPKAGLLPNPECPEHGIEHCDLVSLGTVARAAAMRLLTTGRAN